jgi:colanic acid/amylovoran biosynthesis glycosyltransferase
LIPYGIDCNLFRRVTPMELAGDIRILHSGRLTQKKGVPDLIRTFAWLKKEFDGISLHILGSGEEMDECRHLVADVRIENAVTFYGARPIVDVLRLMNECHIFVLNSRTSDTGDMEGLPNSILEAMSMEMAVVSTKHAGIPDVIVHNENGFLVNEKDNLALKEILSMLIQNPPLIQTTGAKARKRIEHFFTAERMQAQINAIYNRI